VDNEKLRDKLKLALFDLLYEGFEKSDKWRCYMWVLIW
jgi:hypothetical protein